MQGKVNVQSERQKKALTELISLLGLSLDGLIIESVARPITAKLAGPILKEDHQLILSIKAPLAKEDLREMKRPPAHQKMTLFLLPASQDVKSLRCSWNGAQLLPNHSKEGNERAHICQSPDISPNVVLYRDLLDALLTFLSLFQGLLLNSNNLVSCSNKPNGGCFAIVDQPSGTIRSSKYIYSHNLTGPRWAQRCPKALECTPVLLRERHCSHLQKLQLRSHFIHITQGLARNFSDKSLLLVGCGLKRKR